MEVDNIHEDSSIYFEDSSILKILLYILCSFIREENRYFKMKRVKSYNSHLRFIRVFVLEGSSVFLDIPDIVLVCDQASRERKLGRRLRYLNN